jgi:nucleoside-diphosphate kinase
LKSFSFGFLKPDALEDGLEGEIFERIESVGLIILARKRTVLSPEQIEKIYPHVGDRPFFEGVKEYLAGKEVVVFIVGSEFCDAIGVLDRIKGHNHVSGTIRGDLVRETVVWYSEGEIRLWEEGDHPRQEEVSLNRMMLNRLHSADDMAEVKRCICGFFSSGEIEDLSRRFPFLGALLAD